MTIIKSHTYDLSGAKKILEVHILNIQEQKSRVSHDSVSVTRLIITAGIQETLKQQAWGGACAVEESTSLEGRGGGLFQLYFQL